MAIEWLAGNRLRGTTAERPALGLPSGSVGGWVELGRTTLGSAGDSIDVTGLADKRYLMVLIDEQSSGETYGRMRFNDDSGSNYAARYNTNGASETTLTPFASCVNYATPTANDVKFSVNYIANLSGKEKLVITPDSVGSSTAGAGNAPTRREAVSKWVNTSSVISQVNIDNGTTGDFTSGSECVVLGWDPDDTHTSNFWEELASVELSSAGDEISSGTITAKKYLWLQWHTKRAGAEIENRINFNNDTGSNYSRRSSVNGASDATAGNQSRIEAWSSKTSSSYFYNMFIINNSSNEKLCIAHNSEVTSTGAGNAPARVEFVAKWANTSSQITEIDIINNGSGSFDTGSILKVWGAD